MSEGGGAGAPDDLPAVEARLDQLRRRKRETVRWHMSRDTAERAIAAITGERQRLSGSGKSRRRRRHKRHL